MKLVLIGGGSYGAGEDKEYNLKRIDEKVVKMSGKAHPRLLFIGFTIKSNYYYSFIKKCYMQLGVQCEYLHYDEFENTKTVDSKFKRADILYLGGGNTLLYMNQIKKYGLDKKIYEHANQNKVIVGLSAGSIICSACGCSDSRKYKEQIKYTCVKGLSLIDIVYAPHYSESERPNDMVRFLKYKPSKTAICCDECAALVVDGETFDVISSNEKAKTFKVFYKDKKLVTQELVSGGNVFDLNKKQWLTLL